MEVTPTSPASTATQPPDIRQLDLREEPDLRGFVDTAGGTVDTAAILYGDLTEDGLEDAVVPVSSGGERGDIAVFVYGYKRGRIELLLKDLPDETSLQAAINDGGLTVTEPVFGPGDPLCCPSELKTTTYQWDGDKLAPTSEETNPAQ